MPSFSSYPDCRECALWESATSPGIPTRPLHLSGKPVALLILGEAPGYHEDQQNQSWVGFSGQLLSKFVEAAHFPKYSDIYLANACRCRPQPKASPTGGQINTCRQHLLTDIKLLQESYEEVVILCCGASAVKSITGLASIKSSFSHQGKYTNTFKKAIDLAKPCRVFFTYHPAILAKGRKPAYITAVSDHFHLVERYLAGKWKPREISMNIHVEEPIPSDLPPMVCIDIETYGILRGSNQTVFHPVKSQHIDHIFPKQMIVSVSFGFYRGNSVEVYYYPWENNLANIRGWIRHLADAPYSVLLGQNIKFDVSYLRYCDPIIAHYLTPSNIVLDDTLLASFLWYEQRPEKGLKELATLFGLADYQDLLVTGSVGNARHSKDKNLIYYNCLDVATTLNLYAFTWEKIKERYGPQSPKLTKTCQDMRNAILWDVIDLESSGCAFSREKLGEVEAEAREKVEESVAEAEEAGLILAGKGSEKSCRSFMEKAFTSIGMMGSDRIKLTPKKGEISVSKDNFNLLIDSVPADNAYARLVGVLKTYRKYHKLLSSYTSRLLGDPRVGIVHDNIAYPSWYPIPARLGKETDNTGEGGTIQGRFACKKPALQTFPPPIKDTLISRFEDGIIKGYDLSQIELRVAALLSGDPVMLEEYRVGKDKHTETALTMFPDADPSSEDFRRTYRQMAKTMNFLVIYRGGAVTLQQTILKDIGIHLPLEQLQVAIRRFFAKYEVLQRWQDSLIRTVRRVGYLELPTGWSRYWAVGSSVDSHISEICDFPIQTIAAQLLESAHFSVVREMRKKRMRSRIIAQIHDALYPDIYPPEAEEVHQLLDRYLTRPPLLDRIEDELSRTVPIMYEVEE